MLLKIILTLLSVYAVDAAWKFSGNAVFLGGTRMFSHLTKPIVPSLMTDTKNIMSFLHTIEHLKLEKRTGWHQEGIPFEKTESIADHMYRMAIMACVVQDESIDKFKAVKMALVHDMAEALVGDITPSCGISVEEKNRRETEAMQYIKEILGDNPFGSEAQELWLEYAADITKESQFVKDIDKTELYVQVVEYENKFGINFQHWLSRSRPMIRHPALQAIADAAESERPAAFRTLTLDEVNLASTETNPESSKNH